MHHVYPLYVQSHNLDITAGVLWAQKGVAKVVPNGHFSRLIFLFPKLLGWGGGGAEKFSDIPFSLTYRNLYNTPRSYTPGFGI
jgi:hypothetical protein